LSTIARVSWVMAWAISAAWMFDEIWWMKKMKAPATITDSSTAPSTAEAGTKGGRLAADRPQHEQAMQEDAAEEAEHDLVALVAHEVAQHARGVLGGCKGQGNHSDRERDPGNGGHRSCNGLQQAAGLVRLYPEQPLPVLPQGVAGLAVKFHQTERQQYQSRNDQGGNEPQARMDQDPQLLETAVCDGSLHGWTGLSLGMANRLRSRYIGSSDAGPEDCSCCNLQGGKRNVRWSTRAPCCHQPGWHRSEPDRSCGRMLSGSHQQRRHLVRVDRLAEQKILVLVVGHLTQHRQLTLGLDTLGHRLQLDTARQVDDLERDRGAVLIASEVADKGPVDLQARQGKALQAG